MTHNRATAALSSSSRDGPPRLPGWPAIGAARFCDSYDLSVGRQSLNLIRAHVNNVGDPVATSWRQVTRAWCANGCHDGGSPLPRSSTSARDDLSQAVRAELVTECSPSRWYPRGSW